MSDEEKFLALMKEFGIEVEKEQFQGQKYCYQTLKENGREMSLRFDETGKYLDLTGECDCGYFD